MCHCYCALHDVIPVLVVVVQASKSAKSTRTSKSARRRLKTEAKDRGAKRCSTTTKSAKGSA